jgi:hypothetical protein
VTIAELILEIRELHQLDRIERLLAHAIHNQELIMADLTNVTASVAKLEQDFAALQAAVNALPKDTTAQSDVDALQTRVDAVNTGMEALTASLPAAPTA